MATIPAMTGAWLEGGRLTLRDDVPVPDPPEGEALVRASDRVLVLGDGRLGQLVARTLALTDCDLVVVGKHESKLDLLAAAGIRTRSAGAVPDRSFDVAVECTGNPEGFAQALSALRPRGTLVMKSTYAPDLTLRAASIVVDEITMVGSRCGPFAPALRLLAEGKVDVTCLIHARYPLREAVAAFEHARRPGVLKVLLEMDPSFGCAHAPDPPGRT